MLFSQYGSKLKGIKTQAFQKLNRKISKLKHFLFSKLNFSENLFTLDARENFLFNKKFVFYYIKIHFWHEVNLDFPKNWVLREQNPWVLTIFGWVFEKLEFWCPWVLSQTAKQKACIIRLEQKSIHWPINLSADGIHI